MFNKRFSTLAPGAVITLALSGFALSASVSSAAEYIPAQPLLAYDLKATAPSDAPAAEQQDADDAEPQMVAAAAC